eukprot:CAMPEP_0194482968 /NCGR_PEP_ID=MMETSP0253-20130528/4707_1 /TAXON_ID=2966 /ORGANISM="Noctiluca scintillans" /LENGTH=61 /DNA_ID=CAMNT_0039322557 /DNA_START=110 /DNA_END=292 /DNA_ORIENTATION=+
MHGRHQLPWRSCAEVEHLRVRVPHGQTFLATCPDASARVTFSDVGAGCSSTRQALVQVLAE